MCEYAPQERSSGLPTAPASGPVHPPSTQALGSMAIWEHQCWVPHCVPFSVCAPRGAVYTYAGGTPGAGGGFGAHAGQYTPQRYLSGAVAPRLYLGVGMDSAFLSSDSLLLTLESSPRDLCQDARAKTESSVLESGAMGVKGTSIRLCLCLMLLQK